MFKSLRVRARPNPPTPAAPASFLCRTQQLRRQLSIKARSKFALPVRSVSAATAARLAQFLSGRINVIYLFGSQRLIRDADGRSWVKVCASENPERLTERESMFINAALTAARAQ